MTARPKFWTTMAAVVFLIAAIRTLWQDRQGGAHDHR